MSGHSKWSQIKRKKAATDAARGRSFTKVIKEITIAARAGGGDPEGNPRLRTAVAAARAANMPAANIERAIKRGTGEIEGVTIEETHYEGYGPHGVAILVEVATDNRNRASGDIRNIFTRHGGALAAAGAVSYLFKPRGILTVARAAVAEETLLETALDAGADDLVTGDESYEVFTPPQRFEAVKEALATHGIAVQHAELTKIASTTVPLDEKNAAGVLRLVEALEEHDDVQKVYANFEIADEILARLSR